MFSFFSQTCRRLWLLGSGALALAVVAPNIVCAAEPPPELSEEECSRAYHRQPPDDGTPVGSMQRDTLLADNMGNADGVTCRESHTPLISELTRHVARFSDDIWWNDSSGLSLGVVHRSSWKQWFRDHFEFYDEEGKKRAEGTQPLWSPGILYSTLSELYVTNVDHELLVYMYGTFFTLAKVRFYLHDKDGQRVADAHVDLKKSSVVFTLPNEPFLRVASLLREEAVSESFDRWRMIVLREDVLPDDAWPILAAFFARYQDPTGLAALGRMLRSGPGAL